MGKRQAGEGSAHKRADGRWQASRSIGPRGQAKRLYGYGRTRKEAFEDLHRKVDAHERHADLDATDRWTVAQYLDWWTGEELPARVADGTLSPSSLTAYESVANELAARLGKVRLAALSPAHVRRMLTQAAEDGRSDNRRHRLHKVLSIALGTAERYELVDRNPVSRVPAPKRPVRGRPQVSVDQARRLLAAADGHRVFPFVRLMLSVPLRPGEPLALAVDEDDLDLDAGLYVVRRNLIRERTRQGYRWARHATKGKRERTVPLPPETVVVLRQHRASVLERRLADGWQPQPVWDPEGRREAWPLFPSPRGQWQHLTTVAYDLARICDGAGMGRLRPHDLRRLAVTMLTEQGVNPRVLQQMSGHTDMSVTDVYVGALDQQMREAVDGLAGRLAQ